MLVGPRRGLASVVLHAKRHVQTPSSRRTPGSICSCKPLKSRWIPARPQAGPSWARRRAGTATGASAWAAKSAALHQRGYASDRRACWLQRATVGCGEWSEPHAAQSPCSRVVPKARVQHAVRFPHRILRRARRRTPGELDTLSREWSRSRNLLIPQFTHPMLRAYRVAAACGQRHE
jgi:hypothetical protein